MCRHTGKRLTGWDHIRQSLDVIFTTRVGTRLERRAFGSVAPDLTDKPSVPEIVLDYYVAIAEAIDAYEPRVELNGFALEQADENGAVQIRVEVTEVATGQRQNIGYAI
ncbi:GPW/gp25 family protein [Halocynthiibacter styelae]|uniref:GPW/gp25 family protein n=1 Tax=Halocynthiibacter styelae TaxID=2761955 RepID=A0A8J7IEB1_9RHOB|nr:GPW/gp25 family protein [Paenihalocynthiibacter styelae]MBI1495403.1 GPW/gp25 family protein [Paenihalocynthiibacter styelae]